MEGGKYCREKQGMGLQTVWGMVSLKWRHLSLDLQEVRRPATGYLWKWESQAEKTPSTKAVKRTVSGVCEEEQGEVRL